MAVGSSSPLTSPLAGPGPAVPPGNSKRVALWCGGGGRPGGEDESPHFRRAVAAAAEALAEAALDRPA
jgi:hypothetical protein